MNHVKIAIFSFLLLFLPYVGTMAGDCYADPIYERNWHGKYNTAAFVRDRACMNGTSIIETVAGGTVVEVIAETDGWYKVRTPQGKTGWTGARLMSITNEALSASKNPEPTKTITTNNSTIDNYYDNSFLGRVRGKLLLQVEDKGRIWYVNPETDKRYEVTREGAMDLFRNQALGITNENLNKIPKNSDSNHNYDSSLRNNVRGKILLQGESAGETWYMIPGELRRVQITVESLMDIFRSYSLGITNTDLDKISRGDISEKITNTPSPSTDAPRHVSTNNLPNSAIVEPVSWQKYTGTDYNFYYPSNWYKGTKSYQPSWIYLSEEKDYIDNLNTRNYLAVDTYVLTYKSSGKCSATEADSTCLKKGGYYLSGYAITESDNLNINDLSVLREKLYAPRGTVVYGNRTTTENETIILYTYRKGSDLYRVQYFNAHWQDDYGITQFDAIGKTFAIN